MSTNPTSSFNVTVSTSVQNQGDFKEDHAGASAAATKIEPKYVTYYIPVRMVPSAPRNYSQGDSPLLSSSTTSATEVLGILTLKVKNCAQSPTENHRYLLKDLNIFIKKLENKKNENPEPNDCSALISALKCRVQLFITLNEIDLALNDLNEILSLYADLFRHPDGRVDEVYEAKCKAENPDYHEILLLVIQLQIEKTTVSGLVPSSENLTQTNKILDDLLSYKYKPEIVNYCDWFLNSINADPEKIEEAIDYFSSHIESKSIGYTTALKLRALAFARIGEWDNVAKDLEPVCEVNDFSVHKHYNLHARIAAEKSPEEALALIEKIKAFGGNYTDAAREIFLYYFNVSDDSNAQIFLKMILGHCWDHIFIIAAANFLLMQNQPNEVIKYFGNINSKDQYCLFLASAYFATNRHSEVLTITQRSTEEHPDHTLFQLLRIASFLALGQSENAGKTIQILLSVFSDSLIKIPLHNVCSLFSKELFSKDDHAEATRKALSTKLEQLLESRQRCSEYLKRSKDFCNTYDLELNRLENERKKLTTEIEQSEKDGNNFFTRRHQENIYWIEQHIKSLPARLQASKEDIQVLPEQIAKIDEEIKELTSQSDLSMSNISKTLFTKLKLSEKGSNAIHSNFPASRELDALIRVIKHNLEEFKDFIFTNYEFLDQAGTLVLGHIEESFKENSGMALIRSVKSFTYQKLPTLPCKKFASTMKTLEKQAHETIHKLIAEAKYEEAFQAVNKLITTLVSLKNDSFHEIISPQLQLAPSDIVIPKPNNISPQTVTLYVDLYCLLANDKPVTLAPPLFCLRSLLTHFNYDKKYIDNLKPDERSNFWTYTAHYQSAKIHIANYNTAEGLNELKFLQDHQNLWDHQAYLLSGEILFWSGDYEEASYKFYQAQYYCKMYLDTLPFLKAKKALPEAGLKLLESYEFCGKTYISSGQRRQQELISLIYYKLGDLDKAREHMEEALKLYEIHSCATILFAKIACHSSIEAGLKSLEPLRLRGGNILLAHKDLACQLFADKKFAILLQLLNELIKIYPYDAAFFKLRGQCHLKLNNPKECLLDFSRFKLFNGGSFDYDMRLNSLVALYQLKQYSDALKFCDIEFPRSNPTIDVIRLACYTHLGQVKQANEITDFYKNYENSAPFADLYRKDLKKAFFDDYSMEEIHADPFLNDLRKTALAILPNLFKKRDTRYDNNFLKQAEKIIWKKVNRLDFIKKEASVKDEASMKDEASEDEDYFEEEDDDLWKAKSYLNQTAEKKLKPIADCFLDVIDFLESNELIPEKGKKLLESFTKLDQDPNFTEKSRLQELLGLINYKLGNFAVARKHLKIAFDMGYELSGGILAKIECQLSFPDGLEFVKQLEHSHVMMLISTLQEAKKLLNLLEVLNMVLENHPDNESYLYARARCYIALNNPTKSLEDIIRLEDIEKNHEAFTQQFFSESFKASFKDSLTVNSRYLTDKVIALYHLKKYEEVIKLGEAFSPRIFDKTGSFDLIYLASLIHKGSDPTDVIKKITTRGSNSVESYAEINKAEILGTFFNEYTIEQITKDSNLSELLRIGRLLIPNLLKELPPASSKK